MTIGGKEKIKRHYFQPFIESLKKSNLDEHEVIKETFRYLQLKSADLHQDIFNDVQKTLKFLHDFDNAIMNDSFKQKLITYPLLKEQFINLGFLYLDVNRQEQVFSGVDNAEIQTCVRELFHNYLNPLPEIKINNLNTVSISKSDIKNDSHLLNEPFEIKNIIYSYLDCESILSFKKTCKYSYFFHKNILDKPVNILYLIANVNSNQTKCTIM